MKASLALSIVLGAVLGGCRTAPYTHRRQLDLMPADQETKLGLTAYQQALSEAKLSTDAAAVAMLRRVGERLAKAADKPDYKWEFNLIEDSKTVNAWCLPGGKVAVYSGILPVTRDENGLAVVLGHEISHALARHGAERISQGMLTRLGGQALAIGMGGQSAAAQVLTAQAYGLGTQVGVLLPFSRKQESEADHIGIILMAKAGYDPANAVPFWERMAALNKGGGGGLARYLATHPPDKQRIADIKKELPEAERYYKGAKPSE